MPTTLLTYARHFLNDEAMARRVLDQPVLIWETPHEGFEDELFTTEAGAPKKTPRSGAPLVFELKKSSSKTNAFAMGVTVGRTGNNDIVLQDISVSRFHAYFQQDGKDGRWTLVDAESKNGSWVDGVRLTSGKAELVPNHARLRFGEVYLSFLLPESFFEFLQKRFAR